MKRALPGTLALLSLVVACGGEPPPAPVAPAPPPPAPTAEAKPVEPPKAEPTAEEKKKAEQIVALAKDRAKMEADHKAELARWTPELHAEAKALADKTFPSGKAAIQAAMASKTRMPGDADRDKYRHPAETLDFAGFKPGMTVLELGPGEGWYTELLAPALAKKGKLIVANSDPNGPADARSTYYGQRFKLFLETSPELYGKVEPVVVDFKAPKLAQEGTVDMVVLFRELHGMVTNNKMGEWLGELHKALKPNGVLVVEQHRAKPDANAEESAKKGYLPEKWVIEKIEAAGFMLAGKSEINANAKDTKDYADGVWTLPPSFKLGDTDRAKYAAIGESDRMTLKFTKVAAKPAPKTTAAAPAKPGATTAPAKPAAAPAPAKKP
jgi:predicted methyltransferase